MPRKVMTMKQRVKKWDEAEKRRNKLYKGLMENYENDKKVDHRPRSKEAHSYAAFEFSSTDRCKVVIVNYRDEDGKEKGILFTRGGFGEKEIDDNFKKCRGLRAKLGYYESLVRIYDLRKKYDEEDKEREVTG